MVNEEIYEKAYGKTMEMIESGSPITNILTYLTKAADKASGPDTVASILVLDKEGLLRNGASPQLPVDYIKAIDGLRPDPQIGTCAAAAATGALVVTEDFNADDKWAELRHLPKALGFQSAWSVPIINDQNKVLGTFGTYFRQKRTPSPNEIKGIKLLASAAAIAMNNGANG